MPFRLLLALLLGSHKRPAFDPIDLLITGGLFRQDIRDVVRVEVHLLCRLGWS